MVVRRYLRHVDGDSASGFHVSILDALYNMRCAWGMVTPETITNCFKHAGFCAEEDSTQRAPNADSAIEELSALFNRIDDADAGLEEYVNIDSDLPVTGDVSVSVDSIVDSIKKRQEPPEDDDDDEDEAAPLVTGSDANSALLTLRRFALQHKDGASLFDLLHQMEDKVGPMICSNKRQTGIMNFFPKSISDS